MSATARVENLIAAVVAAGGVIQRDGDMIELAAPQPLPADLVARIREAKPALLAILSGANDWPARHREALVYWGALYPAEKAAQLAWGEMQWRWHQLHGARALGWQCAGCGEPISRLAMLDLGGGNRVHFETLDCLLAFGERWRGEATAGLQPLGSTRPAGRYDRARRLREPRVVSVAAG